MDSDHFKYDGDYFKVGLPSLSELVGLFEYPDYPDRIRIMRIKTGLSGSNPDYSDRV